MAFPEAAGLVFRPLGPADLEEIAAIERSSFPDPWEAAFFLDCLRQGCVCRVLEKGGRIDAYGVLFLRGRWAHLLNLCVRLECQGRGLGRRMLVHMLEQARLRHADTIFLDVRISNAVAINLYRSEGFVEVGRRKDYYRKKPGGREDALVLARALD